MKVGYLETGEKVRISKKSGALIPKPVVTESLRKERLKSVEDGLKDTKSDDVLTQTYFGEDFAKVREEFQEYIKKREQEASWLVFPE